MSVINFEKKLNLEERISIDELSAKIYNNRQINNIWHELMMAIDMLIRNNKYEFKTAADKDYIMDRSHKFLIELMSKYIKDKTI